MVGNQQAIGALQWAYKKYGKNSKQTKEGQMQQSKGKKGKKGKKGADVSSLRTSLISMVANISAECIQISRSQAQVRDEDQARALL